MRSGKIFIALSVVFGLIAAGFIGMTVLGMTSGENATEQQKTEAAAADIAISSDAEYDAPGAALKNVVSNSYKTTSFPNGILEELKQAYAVNGDLAGYVSIPGTELSTVVVKSSDNSYYLKRDFFKRSTGELSSTNYGNIYLDYRCGAENLSKNMIIYGHTTGRDTGILRQSFRSLHDFKNKQTFINSPIIRYSTLKETYVYKICAVFLATTQPSADNGYVFNYIYPDMSDSNMSGYIQQVKQRALYETGVSLEPTDKIITLSTCIYDYGKSVDTRLVIVGRLLHEGESESIDASLVKDNPDYRRPQIWYNSKGKQNPYKGSDSWQPSPN